MTLLRPAWKENGMIKRASTILFAALVSLALAADLGGRELRVGTNATYPPFATVDDTGEIRGFDVDLVNEICLRINCVPRVEAVAPDMITASLNTDMLDFVASAVTITPERAEIMLFSDPYFTVEQSIVTRVEDEDLELADFSAEGSQLRLGAQISTTNAETAEELVGRDRTEIYLEFNDAILALLHHAVDGVVIDGVSAEVFVQRNAGELAIAVHGVESGEQLGLVLRQGNPLVDDLNEGIRQLREDGTLEELVRRWF
jgi:polar amino acid transport system substrate-binding protein